MQHFLMLYDAVVVWPGSRYNVVSGRGIRTSSIFNSQHAATHRNMVAKRTQQVAPNVAICCVQMLRSFGRSLQMLCQQCWDMLR